jgi:hypothetical protein
VPHKIEVSDIGSTDIYVHHENEPQVKRHPILEGLLSVYNYDFEKIFNPTILSNRLEHSVKAVAWHPYLQVVAIAHVQDIVLVFDLNDEGTFISLSIKI